MRGFAVLVWAMVLWSLAAPAALADGEFDFAVALTDHSPAGTHPATVPGMTGDLALSLAVNGALTGSLTLNGVTAGVSGKYRRRGAKETLSLKGTGTQRRLRVKLTRLLGATTYLGKVRRGAAGLPVRAELSVDVSASPALVADVRAATRNGLGKKRTGIGTVQVGGATFGLATTLRRGRTTDLLKLTGTATKISVRGVLGDDAMTVRRFKLKSFGAVVAGGGTIGFSPNGPDVALILSSGHHFSGGVPGVASESNPYLTGDAGPTVEMLLDDFGLSHATFSFVDHHSGTQHGPGYEDMVTTLLNVRDQWVDDRVFPTQVIVVAHSHGGVRAHRAIQAVPDLAIAVLIDLDASSCLYKTGHVNEPFYDPDERFVISSFLFDTEDVVFDNVLFNLDVDSSDECGFLIFTEPFDDALNVRLDGSRDRIWSLVTDTDHGEVHEFGGTTLREVEDWLFFRLLDIF